MDLNVYPCEAPYRNNIVYSPRMATNVYGRKTFLDRVYVKKRGWIIVLFTSNDGCKFTTCAKGSYLRDWQVEHLRTASVYTTFSYNYNVPNDPYLWEIGDLIFGGNQGVGSCAERCPSSGEYDNIKGTIKWKPQFQAAVGQQYWLYTTFSVGESLACKFFNCDEAAFEVEKFKYRDEIPNPDGLHPLSFFEGTSMVGFVPQKLPMRIKSGCVRVGDGDSVQFDESKQTNALSFQISRSLFGTQRITDFSFCAACVDNVCERDVMPCRWQSLVDTTWRYYMYIFYKPQTGAEMPPPAIFSFHIQTPGVIDSDYSDETVFTGYTVSSTPGPETPVYIPVLANITSFIYTTEDRECVDLSGTVARRLLSENLHATTQVQRFSRRRHRVNALSHHGRQIHSRPYSSLHASADGEISSTLKPHITFTGDTLHSPSAAETARFIFDQKQVASRRKRGGLSHNNRMLLSMGSAPSESNNVYDVNSQESDADTGNINSSEFSATTREITCINNNEQITRVLCGNVDSPINSTCDMLEVSKQLPIEDFCLTETDFLEKSGPLIRAQLLNASSSAVSEIFITSVSKPNFQQKCRPAASRRLLQTETVHITYVMQANDTYYMNLDLLVDNGFSDLQRLTSLLTTKLTICASNPGFNNSNSTLSAVGMPDATNMCSKIPIKSTFVMPAIQPDVVFPPTAEVVNSAPVSTEQFCSSLGICILYGIIIFVGVVFGIFCIFYVTRGFCKKTPVPVAYHRQRDLFG